MGVELERWRCPHCGEHADVWREDGRVTSECGCPNCYTLHPITGRRVPLRLVYDPAATAELS